MKIRFAGLSRRQVVRGAACAVLLGLVACVGGTTNADIFTPWGQPRGPNPAFARQVVTYPTHERPGTIIVDPYSHFLYVIHDAGQAIRYGVGVGAEGFVWSGRATVHSKQEWPDWDPPPRGAPYVKLLRRAANVTRDRLERELRLACRLGGGGLLGLGRLVGVLRGGRGVELRLRVGLGPIELRPRLRGVGSRLLLQLLGPRLGLVRLCGGECFVGERELCVGAGLEPFKLAPRRRERCCLACRCRGGFLRFFGHIGGLRGLAS